MILENGAGTQIPRLCPLIGQLTRKSWNLLRIPPQEPAKTLPPQGLGRIALVAIAQAR